MPDVRLKNYTCLVSSSSTWKFTSLSRHPRGVCGAKWRLLSSTFFVKRDESVKNRELVNQSIPNNALDTGWPEMFLRQ